MAISPVLSSQVRSSDREASDFKIFDFSVDRSGHFGMSAPPTTHDFVTNVTPRRSVRPMVVSVVEVRHDLVSAMRNWLAALARDPAKSKTTYALKSVSD